MKKALIFVMLMSFVLTFSSGVLAKGHGNSPNECISDWCEGNNWAEIDQHGRFNLAGIWQEGRYQVAKVDQNGRDNMAAVMQFGGWNTAIIEQWGYGNGCYDNLALILQGDFFNHAKIKQVGSGNMAGVVQNIMGNHNPIPGYLHLLPGLL